VTGSRVPLGSVALAALVVAWWATRVVGNGTRRALDVVLYALPTYAATWERLRAGVVPLWNPYVLCGIPWLGTLQGGTFYPLHVFYGLLPLHVAFAVVGVLHLLLAALATAAFVRRLGLGVAAAGLAAVAFTMRGEVPSALEATYMLETITWLPVGAVALVDLVRCPGRRPIALLAAATAASCLAGYPQTTVYTVYAWGSLFLALLVHERTSPSGIATRAAAFAGALALGIAIAAVQILPALELMSVGTRSAGLTDRTMFPRGDLNPGPLRLWLSISGTPFAFGLLALALAPAALLAPRRHAIGVWALGVAVLSGAWALGRATPLFDLYLALPAMRLFRIPFRQLFVPDFAVAIAAALGLAAVTGDAPARIMSRAVAIVLMALGLVGVFVLARRGLTLGSPDRVAFAAATGVVAIVALLVAPPSRRAAVGAAIATAVAIDIASNPWRDVHLPYAAADLAPYQTIAPDLDHMAQLAGHDRVWRALAGIRMDHALKLSTWHRLRTITDYEPTNLKRQSDFWTYFADASTTMERFPFLFMGDIDVPETNASASTRRRLLDLAAVRYVVFPSDALASPVVRAFVAQAGLAPDAPTPHLAVFRNPSALPRAFVTYRVRTAPPDASALLATLSAETFDPLSDSFVEGPPPFVAADDAPRGHAATFVRDDETDVELDVSLERPGLVVLADSFYPGWYATVDGAPAPIVATNHLFRGVPAPVGSHRVRFVYAPASVRVGGAVSVLGIVVLGWLALGGRRARRGTP
jgi:hypothetical protein